MSQVANGKREVMPRSIHKPLHIYLRDEGTILSTRERGKRLAERIRVLADEPGDIILDFVDVDAGTPPFLQEVIDAVHSVVLRDPDTGRSSPPT